MPDTPAASIELGRLREKFARKYDVILDIHSADFIFQHLRDFYFKGNLEEALDWYYWLGRENASKIAQLTRTFLRRPNLEAISILDFASGYGGVARHVGKVLPGARLVAMDIHEQAVHFNQARLTVPSLISSNEPTALDATTKYDVVFALSFFSHVPKQRFFAWLAKLSEFVAADGLLIFTTHGLVSHRLMPRITVDSDGYGFQPNSEQEDLSKEDYGMAVTHPKFVFSEISKLSGYELLLFREAFWWEHQDSWVLLRGQIPKPELPPGPRAFKPERRAWLERVLGARLR